MNSIHLGIGGVALALTVILWFGTASGGKYGLSWGWALFLSMVAGCAFKAAGEPFSWISDLTNDGLGMIGDAFPKITSAGFAIVVLLLVCFKKMSLRQLIMCGIVFVTVAAGADGTPFHWVSGRIEIIAMHWA